MEGKELKMRFAEAERERAKSDKEPRMGGIPVQINLVRARRKLWSPVLACACRSLSPVF